MIHVTIKGLQAAQQANLKLMAAIKPEGALGRATLYLATQAERYAVSITHVDTGALRASHRIERLGAAQYRIHIDQGGRNPRTGARTSIYGPVEHSRGGSHAFYERTVYGGGPAMLQSAARYIVGELP